jgi:hypothetical protein
LGRTQVIVREPIVRFLSRILAREGNLEIAKQVESFTKGLPPPMTDREWLAAKLVERRRDGHTRDNPVR